MFLRINVITTFSTITIFPPGAPFSGGWCRIFRAAAEVARELAGRKNAVLKSGHIPRCRGKDPSLLSSLCSSPHEILWLWCSQGFVGWGFWGSRCWWKWSLVLPFTILLSPNTAVAALGSSQHKSGAAFISEPRIRLALCLVVVWLLTVVGIWEVL